MASSIAAQHIQVLEELAIRKARTDYFTFLKYMFPSNVKWNWHHKYICNVLNDFILNDDIKNLMIFTPPQHQKSTMMTEYLSPFAYGQNPDYKIILSMYNATMAAKYNRKMQRIIDNEKYAKIFPHVKLNAKNIVSATKGSYVRNSDEFEIVGYQGFMKTVGVGGGIAGNPAKIALLDDVIKSVEEANSVTYRNKIYDWYTDELEARLHNDSKVAFTITRRHEDDLAGRLIARDGTIEEGGKWKVVICEAIKETNCNPDDKRAIGEALFPELHSLERLQEIRAKSPRTFVSLYQQRPTIDGGDILKKEYFEIVDKLPFSNNPVNLFIDSAYTEKQQNDPSGILVAKEINNIVYLINYFGVRKQLAELCQDIIRAVNVYGDNRTKVYIENKASGLSVYQYLKRHTKINAIEYKQKGVDKVARTNIFQPFYESKRVVLLKGTWNKAFLECLAMFPNVSHDEEVDVLNMATDIYLAKPKAKPRQAKFVNLDPYLVGE